MAIVETLEKLLQDSSLIFEEQRAFMLGLGYLSVEEQTEFARILEENPTLIYPLYINFKAKLRAIKGTEAEWEEVVESEIKEFEKILGSK